MKIQLETNSNGTYIKGLKMSLRDRESGRIWSEYYVDQGEGFKEELIDSFEDFEILGTCYIEMYLGN